MPKKKSHFSHGNLTYFHIYDLNLKTHIKIIILKQKKKKKWNSTKHSSTQHFLPVKPVGGAFSVLLNNIATLSYFKPALISMPFIAAHTFKYTFTLHTYFWLCTIIICCICVHFLNFFFWLSIFFPFLGCHRHNAWGAEILFHGGLRW